MVKGRVFVPTNGKEGIWFQHRGTELMNWERNEATSTGRMMSAPFDSRTRERPNPPPSPFVYKSELNYSTSNKFSQHDNRNKLQEDGTYFGNGKDTRGLGKQITSIEKRQHFTATDQLGHKVHGLDSPYYVNSEYQTSFQGRRTELPPVHRRFPKVYSAPKEGRITLDTSTSDWHPPNDPVPKASLRVLAISQQPFLKHNPFKYSYHGMPKIYPSYTRQEDTLVNNIFNRYGAAFPEKS